MKAELDQILAENGADALLLYSDSQKDANMYYVTNFLAPDPFIYLKKADEQAVIVVSQMEYSRAQKQASVKDVKSVQDYDYLRVVKTAKTPNWVRLSSSLTWQNMNWEKKPRYVCPQTFP